MKRRALDGAPLRHLLVFGFGLFAATLTFALGSVLENFASRQLQAQIEDKLAATSAQMRDKLDRGMFERFRDVQIAASLVDVFDPSAPKDAQRAWLEKLQSTFRDYAWIGFADASGRVLSATGALLEGADVSSRPWWKEAREKPVMGDVHDAKLLQKLLAPPGADPLRFVDASAPVIARDGRFLGVLGAHVSWSWAKEIRASVFAEGGAAEGVELLVYSRDGALLLGPEGGEAPEQVDIWNGRPDIELLADGYIVRISGSDGYRSYPGLGWWVVARQPVAAALAPVASLRHAFVQIGLLVILAFMAIGWMAANVVARPLERLARWAAAFAAGAPEERAPTFDGCREASVLAEALSRAFAGLSAGKAELQVMNGTLERKVQDRTRALASAKDQALAATRAKSDFLATMSHELRTPLHSIRGTTEMLRAGGGLTDEQTRRLDLIETASAALLQVIGDVLDFSKLEAGRLEIDPGPFALSSLVEQSAQIVGPAVEAKGLEIRVVVDGDAPARLIGDEARLRQVLLNLLNNAVKFSERGAIELSVAVVPSEGDAPLLHFAVADEGVGVAPETKARLFDRFTQADATTSRKYGGTGLGLAISRHLVEAMGGRIDVDSEPGRGSTFWFEVALPVAADAPVAAAVPAPAQPARAKRVLLAEDIAINQEIAAAFLRAAGHEVEVANDGAEAVAAVGARPFDLVLMDVHMPVMDGLDALRAIRALPGAARDVAVVAMTANVLSDEVARFAAEGFDGHIGKPFGREELVRKVAEATRMAA